MESKTKTKNSKIIDTENRLVVARGREGENARMGEGDQKIQNSS